MVDDEYQAAVTAFIRANGITCCPTGCALPTQGTVAAADRAALEGYTIAQDTTRRRRLAMRERVRHALQPPGE